MLTLEHYLMIGAILFALGLISIIGRKNAIGILIGVELILNAASINFVAFSHYSAQNLEGQVFAIFIIMLAACEAVIALAIIINLFASFGAIDVDKAGKMKR